MPGPVVVTEICGTSITSGGRGTPCRLEQERLINPHVRYATGAIRGYIHVTLDRDEATASLRGVEDVRWNKSGVSTIARFTIENGRPGARVAGTA